MTTFRQIQDEVLQILHSYGAEQPRTTYLNASLTDSALTVSVRDASNIDQGLAEVEGELVFIDSVNRDTNVISFAPDGRGFYGTTAVAHTSGTRLTVNPTWPRNRVQGAVNDVIVSTYPTLFGVAQSLFTFNPSVTTYSVPAEAERILAVTADVNGPSMEQQVVSRYRFNSMAPTDDWATTNTLTLHESVSPGRTVTVSYAKAPSALAADDDALTTSGLRETAKSAIVYGACSQLVGYMDVARLPADTATSDEFTERNQIGMASRIAGQLYLRYQAELDNERRRLRSATPVPIVLRKR